jgi:uncharacterized protein YggE
MSKSITCRGMTAWLSFSLSVLLTSGAVTAQEAGTITVTGSGVGSAAPDYVVIQGEITASAENAEEAVKEFRELRHKVEDDISADDSVSLRLQFGGEELSSGPTVGASAGIGGLSASSATPPGQIGVSETIEMRIDFKSDMQRMQAIEQAAKVIAKAKEAGVQFSHSMNPMMIAMGQQASGILEFGIDDPRKVQAAAYKKAVEDARARAESLASIAGARLGRIVSIEEVEIATAENPYVSAIAWSAQQQSDSKETKVTTDRNAAVEVRKDLRVVFELLND